MRTSGVSATRRSRRMRARNRHNESNATAAAATAITTNGGGWLRCTGCTAILRLARERRLQIDVGFLIGLEMQQRYRREIPEPRDEGIRETGDADIVGI